MNKHSNENWELLKTITPPEDQKIRIRNRLISSLRTQRPAKRNYKIFEIKNVVLTTVFLLVSAGLLFHLQADNPIFEDTGGHQAGTSLDFTWELENVYSEKTPTGYVFYEEGSTEKIGIAEKVSVERRDEIIKSHAMNVKEELEDFPYPTIMYIEHVKMMDVSLRYHFFIEAGKETIHFSFDYPKLEYAEIFKIIASLDFKKPEPFKHDGLLYVTHGYGTLPFPVGLKPVEFNGDRATYIWENGSKGDYKDYIEKIKTSGEWKETNNSGLSYMFESANGSEIVKISLIGKEITYEFSYPNREE
jgi:hypothetical protein